MQVYADLRRSLCSIHAEGGALRLTRRAASARTAVPTAAGVVASHVLRFCWRVEASLEASNQCSVAAGQICILQLILAVLACVVAAFGFWGYGSRKHGSILLEHNTWV